MSGEGGLALSVHGLARRLGRGEGAFALDVPEIELAPGARAALIGPSGTGKSTALALLALALAPDDVHAFHLGGEDLTDAVLADDRRALTRARARLIGFVPQTGGLVPFLNLRDNILLTQRLSGQEDEGYAEHLAERLGIRAILGRRPDAVSVGQRQRAAVARALAHRPAILLADEPTASVHPTQADDILALLAEAAEEGAAVLVSTHDIARAHAAGLEPWVCDPAADGSARSRVERRRW